MENRKALKPYIPYLPQIPDKIYGEPNSVQKLTNRTESEWQFLFREIKDIPSPYAEAQDYDFNKISPQEFLQSFAEMIEGARNHTSVIIWSLANESDFEKTYAFRAEFDYAKKIDLSRPLIFSYPHLVHSKPLPYDILSKHYAKVTGNLGDKKFPLLHDEFAHVSCLHLGQ